jgi:hypothetical protein
MGLLWILGLSAIPLGLACFVFSWLARGVRQSGRSGVQAGFWQERSGLIVRSFEGKRYLVRLGGDGSDNKPFHGAAKSLA